MRKLAFLVTIISCLAMANVASAQQGDAFIGFGTMVSPGAAQCGQALTTNLTCPEKGGLYMNVGGDVIFHGRLGAAFDADWRAGQGNFAGTGQPYRPLLFDLNADYQPRLSKKAGLDIFGGIGWQSTRFYGYTATSSCVYFGSCYNSTNHFLVDLGAGVRYYVWGHVFVRPEARYYHIMNNTDAFTSGNLVHIGASIGYTIGPD